MQSTTTAKKTRAPRWCKVGIATKQYSALRLEVLVGPARGVYFIAADDVGRMALEESVQVYELRTVQGEKVPTVAGFTYPSSTGAMVIVQVEAPLARFMIPTIALLAHLAHPTANKPTTITAPMEEVEPSSSPALEVLATAGATA